MPFLNLNTFSALFIRGGSSPRLKGGNFGEGVPKRKGRVSAPKARENFLGFVQ